MDRREELMTAYDEMVGIYDDIRSIDEIMMQENVNEDDACDIYTEEREKWVNDQLENEGENIC